MNREISIVIPVYNEESNVSALHAEVKKVCEENGYTYEIIFIDDGSTDETCDVIKTLTPVTCIRFRRNFGQTSAMDAGIKNANYSLIVTMDGDRQNDPVDIPEMINYLFDNNLDIVSGWRKDRKDKFLKRFISRGANFLRWFLIKDGIHDSGCSLKVYKKECFKGISLYGEMHRFIPALLKIKGFNVGEVVVRHRPRTAGRTKYNWRRTFKGFIDMLSLWFWHKFAVRPLHFLGGGGLILGLLGSLAAGLTVIEYIRGQSLSDTVWPILSAFLLLSGMQLFVSGLIADMLSKNYYETTDDRAYSVKEKIVNRE